MRTSIAGGSGSTTPTQDRTDPRPAGNGRAGRRHARRRQRFSWRGHRRRVEARRARRRARRHLVGRHPYSTAAVVVLVGLTPVWVSLGNALTDPSLGITVSARFAEWARDNGGNSIVNWAENTWYSHHPPPIGGRPAKSAIPKPTASRPTSGARLANGLRPLPAPAAIVPIASPAIAGEGQWHPAGRLVDGTPAVYEAYLRPDSVHTSVVVGVAWLDSQLLRAQVYPGSYIPGPAPWKITAPILPSAAQSLVAAFNAGFRLKDANGGYYAEGRMYAPLRAGGASAVIYRDGTMQIGQWGRDLTMTPSVAAVRQNLVLLVDHGAPVAGLNPNDVSSWGFTWNNAVYIWRSGIGETANGAIVYVGGPDMNITDLANVLVRAGCVRAMELDINTDWVHFATFAPTSANGLATPENGKNLLTNMAAYPGRYFTSWARDFFTMSAR